ncbi:methyl-accepting chemotaxis transducer transmembrane I protein [Herbaspirillum sp. GW103]|uniref:methyl-accepting chemotaxis protein n=1 Tax=Herbaspirillum sp. GW103 TaxID=1175306 RepID=UPI00025E5044|nr:methyl-accepting chemotaxis protein [Herbaspirillum sp. GW103]EIJ48012.1 methyl-accepting chemotaxis transducer transmembrane I protein [Herbaspirillum sp. GW103]
MTIANKIRLLLLAVVLGLAGVTGLSIYHSNRIADAASYSSVNTVPSLLVLGEASEAIFGIRVGIWRYAAATDAAARLQLEKSMSTLRDQVLATFDRYEKDVLSDATDRQLLQADRDAFAEYEKNRQRVIALGAEGKNEEALAAVEHYVVPPGTKLINALAAHRRHNEQLGQQGVQTAQNSLRSAIYQAVLMSLFVCVVVALVGQLISRAISTSLGEAILTARAIATGDLSTRIRHRANDEVGQLMQAIQQMTDSLVRIVSNVRNSANTIGTATAEIAAGNLDLSSRTESQAGSIEETASAMEQLTAAVRQNADNAQQANALAISASGVASEGGQAVQEVVKTMEEINASSLKIVDIISVIDGIAFQTNILALNAAVEAARAGEQGRGFAVVASEVRSLAQRSAAAAREIKELIDDSVGKVESGSRLVAQAGATMQQVVGSVHRVADIVGEITAASAEQSDGIVQVNQAIGLMDQATQQNAALVEQAAAASQSLQEQAVQLAGAVQVFKLDPERDKPIEMVSAATPVAVAPVAERSGEMLLVGAHAHG